MSLLEQDSGAALVQTPQSYMNADPVLRNLQLERWLLPDEEAFYRWVEPVRQGVGAVICAGTSFVVRRRALMAVGGFETGTPSEDLATGIRLAAAGWRLHFLAEKLSAGLAPHSAAAMARQRCRWASGTLQILRTGANPFTIAGLTPLQRLAFGEGNPALAQCAAPAGAAADAAVGAAGWQHADSPGWRRPCERGAALLRGADAPGLMDQRPRPAALCCRSFTAGFFWCPWWERCSAPSPNAQTFRVTPKAPGQQRRVEPGLAAAVAGLLAVQGLALIGLLRWPPPRRRWADAVLAE